MLGKPLTALGHLEEGEDEQQLHLLVGDQLLLRPLTKTSRDLYCVLTERTESRSDFLLCSAGGVASRDDDEKDSSREN